MNFVALESNQRDRCELMVLAFTHTDPELQLCVWVSWHVYICFLPLSTSEAQKPGPREW